MTVGRTRMMFKLSAVVTLVAAAILWLKLFEKGFTVGGVFLPAFFTVRGIEWNTEGGYGNGNHSTNLLERSDEWIRFVLEQPTDTAPGSRFEYNDGVSVLLGKILREATGQRIDEWAKENLFEPIGITDFYWKITPDGEADTEGGLYLSLEDLARIGYLFLRGGEWNGRQVVSREWVEASTAPVVPDVAPDNDRPDPGYGYQWWVPDSENGATRVFAANGYGGQFLLVSPEHDIVAVFNGWNIHGAGNRSTWRALQERILLMSGPFSEDFLGRRSQPGSEQPNKRLLQSG